LPADAFDRFKPGSSSPADLHAWFTERAKELSCFVVTFIKQEGVEGDIGVLGWSVSPLCAEMLEAKSGQMGNQTSLSLLAYMDQLPSDEVEILQKHLKVVYIFETSFRFHANIATPHDYSPFVDADIPDAEKPAAFGLWVSSYFTHGDSQSGDWSKLEYKKGRTDRKPTVATYSAEDAAELMDPPAIREAVLFQSGSSHPDEFTLKALVESSHLCPDVRVVVIYADSSIWECVAVPWIFKEQIQKAVDAGGKARPIKYVEAKDANHFLQYDDPKQTIRLLADGF
jgi:hypothetical protein